MPPLGTPPIDPTKVPTDQRERRVWIVGQLKIRGLSLRGLSLRFGYKDGYLHQALGVPVFNAEKIIAQALGTEPRILFPDRYAADGTRTCITLPMKHKRTLVGRNVKGQEVA